MSRRTLIPLLALLTLGTGCAFDRQWRNLSRAQAAAATTTATGDPLAGRWEGKWVSERSGHRGGLRAIITPVDASTYRVDYDATYMGILRFGYGMNLAAKRDQAGRGATMTFSGEENLGALAGGVYRYNGTADGTTFHSTYESGSDNGYFEMSRPAKKR